MRARDQDVESPDLEDADPIERLMIACLDLPEEERGAAMEQACREHPSWAGRLRTRLDALRSIGLDPLHAPRDVRFPERLGDFRLLGRLGSGGMGVVYRAVQESLGREVALKLVRPEQLFFPGARSRFRREVEAVARLQHPGIVPVHCVGEEQGIPYFAMELVEGCSLAAVLERLQGRAPEELRGEDFLQAVRASMPREVLVPALVSRAELFQGTWVQACFRVARAVAEALQHAHERGVLHRDVKPSNVLVTPDGRVLLLDFGLAAGFGAERITRTGSQLGSLPYMSPEQLRGDPSALDSRSDVYSLGATLYELLALELPFRGETEREVARAIEAGEPRPLAASNRSVPWDAETVVRKALERGADQRYATVADFACDLRNVLELRTIQAKRPGLALRARRFVQRHPTVCASALLGFLLLVVGPSLAWWRIQGERDKAVQAKVRADGEALRARDEAAAARAMLDFVLGLFEASDPYSGLGAEIPARELLARGVERIQSEFADRPLVRAELLLHLAWIQRHLGQPLAALPLAEEALAIRARALAPGSAELDQARAGLATVLRDVGELDRSEALYRDALATSLVREGAASDAVARLENELGILLLLRQDHEEAEAIFRRLSLRPRGALEREGVGAATVLNNLGQALLRLERVDEAEQQIAAALALSREEHGELHPDVARSLTLLGDVHEARREYGQGLEALENAESIYRSLQGGSSLDLAGVLDREGQNYERRGLYGAATGFHCEALAMLGMAAGERALLRAQYELRLGYELQKWGDVATAELVLREAVARHDLRDAPARSRSSARRVLAMCLNEQGRKGEAVAWLQSALAALLEEGPLAGDEATDLLFRCGAIFMNDLHRPQEARPYLEENHALLALRGGPPDVELVRSARALGACLFLIGERQDADRLLLESRASALALEPPNRAEVRQAFLTLIDFYERCGERDEAQLVRAELARSER